MNTQTHVIMGALIFGKPLPRLAWVGAAGGIVPDLPMYIIIAGLRAQGHGLDRIFGEFYWHPSWQIANAIGHNFLIWGLVALISGWFVFIHGAGLATYKMGGTAALIFALSASALLHSVIDFACHRNDGHMHFWPLSEWRFESPVSYWDPAYYGTYFSIFEATLGLAMAILLFRRYQNIGLRIVLILAILAYVAVPMFYFWSLAAA